MKNVHAKCLLGVSCSLLVALLGAGCDGTGPGKTLSEVSKALTNKDGGLFLAQFDIKSYAAHEYANMSKENDLLGGVAALGDMLGLRNEIDQMLKPVIDMENRISQKFLKTVPTGELAAQCARMKTADCPWEPTALKNAEVRKLNDDAAVARVTTSANMTSWISLRKVNGAWRIVGRAALEDTAVRYASDAQPFQQNAPESRPAAPQKPQAPSKQPPVTHQI